MLQTQSNVTIVTRSVGVALKSKQIMVFHMLQLRSI